VDGLRAAGLTDVGKFREQNEDHWVADTQHGVFIVSDGMGGRVAGELASNIVVEVLPDMLLTRLEEFQDFECEEAKHTIAQAVAELSNLIHRESSRRPDFSGMGATVVLALVRPPRAMFAHVGDSRAYMLREHALQQLTRDHSIIQILIDMGQLTPEAAATHPARSQITQFVGMESRVFPDVHYIDLKPGDRLLLCSDGLTGMLEDADIADVLETHADPESACQTLIHAANTAGGKDNITAIIVDWNREQE
jgi:protein phosphatase